MTSGDSETNRTAKRPHRMRRALFTAFCCAALAVTAISSCRKNPPADSSAGHKPSSAEQTEPQIAQQTTVAQLGPKRALSKEEQSCKEFVQEFYDWYINSRLSELHSLAWYDVPRLRPYSLSPELRNLLKKEDADQVKYGGIVHLDTDPFLNSQDPSLKYSVESVTVTEGGCLAVVKGSSEVRPELSQSGSGWAFVNFHYSFYSEDWKSKTYPDDDLIHMLKLPIGKPESSYLLDATDPNQ